MDECTADVQRWHINWYFKNGTYYLSCKCFLKLYKIPKKSGEGSEAGAVI